MSRPRQDLLVLTSFSRTHPMFPRASSRGDRRVHIAGVDGAGPWVAAAVAQAGSLVDRVAIDTNRFRFERLAWIDHADFLPGAVKYGDLPALIALEAPHELWLADEGSRTSRRGGRAAYYACGRAHAVHSLENATGARDMVYWLLRP